MSGEVLDTAFVEIKPKFDDAGFAKVGGVVTKAIDPAARAIDKSLSGAFNSAAKTADSASSKIDASFNKTFANVSKSSEGFKAKVSGSITDITKNLGGLLVAGVAADKAFGFVNGTINKASDLNETLSKTQVILGDQGAKAAEQFANTAATAFGQSKQQALDAIGTFATFGKGAGLAGEDLSSFAIKLDGLASDMASFSNTSVDQSIGAIGAALRGETEPIRAYGVLIDQASVQAEALNLGLLKGVKNQNDIKAAQIGAIESQKAYNKAVRDHGKDSIEAQKAQVALGKSQEALSKATKGSIPPLTQQQKVLATQSLILKQTKDAQGDFSRTSSGLANSQRILSARFDNLQATIGKALLPVVNLVIKGLVKFLDVIIAVGAGIATAIKFVKDWAIAFGILGAALLIVNAKVILNTAVTTANTVAQKTAAIATKAWTIATTALGIALKLAGGPLGLIVIAVAAFVGGIVTAYKKSETFRNIVNGVFKAIWGTIKTVLDAIVVGWNATMSALTTALSAVGSFFSSIWNGIRTAFNAVIAAMQVAWNAFTTVLTGVIQAFALVFTAVWTGIQTVFQTVFAVMSAVFQTWWAGVQVILNVIAGAFSLVWNAVKATFQTVVSAMVTIWNAFRDVVAAALRVLQAIFNAVWNGIKAVFIAVVNVMSAAWNGFANGVMAIAHVVGSVANGIWNGMKSAFSTVINSMTSVWNGFIGGVKTALSGIGGAFSSAFGAVTGVVKGTLNGVIGVLNTAIRFINEKLIDTANKVPFVDIPHIGEIPLLQEDGGIHTRPTHTISGENGPEAIVPLGSHKRRQREKVLAAAGLLGGYNGSTAFDRSGGRSSGGSVSAGVSTASSTAKVVNNEYHQTFNLLPGGDPYTHAHQIAARVAAGAGR